MVRKTVTLVFCDVVDSTPLGERLDPEALRGVWSRYHDCARQVLERHGGTVEKFVGDAVMAVFGIPVVHEDDAMRAVRAAVELRTAIAGLNDELEQTFGVRIGLRTGVNTGEVLAGDPAQGQAFATGDAVVVAQRLEAAASSGEILIGDATMRLVRDAVTAQPLGPLVLKGKSEAVAAWCLDEVTPDASGRTRRLDSPLVGRASELARLQDELANAVAGRTCNVVTVLGEPGVGKSRLAAELVSSLGADTLVLEGRCLPYGQGITYWPMAEIVRRLSGPRPPRDVVHELLAGLPEGESVAERVLEAIGLGEPRSRSDELYAAFRSFLETLARDRPTVIVLDDVQWAEPAFLDLVEYLAGWSRDAPMLICCLARPELAELRPSWTAAPAIRLQPLERDESRLLLENMAGPVDPAAADVVGKATGGNPLFLEEMLRMLVEDGLLVERDGRLEALAEFEALRVPETVQAVLAARLDRLDEDERAVLQRAAVIGQVFWWGSVADLTPPDSASEVATHLQALVRKGLVRPDRRTFANEDGFRFGHILIRDAAYESMPKQLRAELHERHADWVESRAGKDADLDEILGHHLEQAYRYRVELGPASDAQALRAERACTTLARAGRRALAREDPHAAAALLGRAASLLAPEAEHLPGVLLDHAIALSRAGALADAQGLFDRLLAADPPARVAASAQLERAMMRIASGQGSLDELLEAAERATEVFAELGDDTGLAQAWNSVATQLFWRGQMSQMEVAAQRALEHARAAGDVRQELWALNATCIALAHGPTPVDEAAARARTLLVRAEELGVDALPLYTLAAIEGMRGNLREAWELYERADTRGVGGVRASVCLYAEPLFELDPERAEEKLRQLLRMLDELGVPTGRPAAVVMLAEALLAGGRHAEAKELMAVPGRAEGEDASTQILRGRTTARTLGGVEGAALAREAVEQARATESSHLLAGALVALAEVTGNRAPLVEAASLWEAKGNAPAVRRLDIRAEAR